MAPSTTGPEGCNGQDTVSHSYRKHAETGFVCQFRDLNWNTMQCASENSSSPVSTTPHHHRPRPGTAGSGQVEALQDLLSVLALPPGSRSAKTDGIFHSCRIDESPQGKAGPGCREPEDANRWAILCPT